MQTGQGKSRLQVIHFVHLARQHHWDPSKTAQEIVANKVVQFADIEHGVVVAMADHFKVKGSS